jgi:hypothetical protein
MAPHLSDLASLLVNPPEPQNMGKTHCLAIFLPFRAPHNLLSNSTHSFSFLLSPDCCYICPVLNFQQSHRASWLTYFSTDRAVGEVRLSPLRKAVRSKGGKVISTGSNERKVGSGTSASENLDSLGHVYINIYIYLFIRMQHACLYVCMCFCMYVCMYVRMYVGRLIGR